uniref:Uncharacterized protein n=1 Tax=Marseillevirus LCMAC101 TaxID=2506602 RepID=A0A481YRX4_9VIRU|nr:MAG: hypothetical protein LCMAC101_00620 [Marseillevirus LCMAC101]
MDKVYIQETANALSSREPPTKLAFLSLSWRTIDIIKDSNGLDSGLRRDLLRLLLKFSKNNLDHFISVSTKIRLYIKGKGKGFKEACHVLDAEVGEEYLIMIGDSVPWDTGKEDKK